MLPVEVSVKATFKGRRPLVGVALKSATGFGGGGAVSVLVTAKGAEPLVEVALTAVTDFATDAGPLLGVALTAAVGAEPVGWVTEPVGWVTEPKTLSSAVLVQGWPLISETATRRT